MATYSSADIGFYLVGGYSILGYQTEIDVKVEKPTEETTVLGSSWEAHSQMGMRRAALSQKGFYDGAANANNDALLATAPMVGALGIRGNVAGRVFVGFAGLIQAAYERIASRGALHKANGDLSVSGQVEDGVIIATHAARSTGGSPTAAVDNTASSASGGAGYLEASALTLGGYTSLTIKLRHSADNITYADLATFSNVTGAPTAERVAINGTINRYVHTTITANGAGAGESITYMAGLVRS